MEISEKGLLCFNNDRRRRLLKQRRQRRRGLIQPTAAAEKEKKKHFTRLEFLKVKAANGGMDPHLLAKLSHVLSYIDRATKDRVFLRKKTHKRKI